MIFGDKNIYAIEVYHEPWENSAYYMSGRMCLHLNGTMLGDITDPCNVLGVTYDALLRSVTELDNTKFNFGLETDGEIFKFLDYKLYSGDGNKIYEQMVTDYKKYKYANHDFLTGGGIMFDKTKSFIYLDDSDIVHIIYSFCDSQIHSAQVKKEIFLSVNNDFFKWFDMTKKSQIK